VRVAHAEAAQDVAYDVVIGAGACDRLPELVTAAVDAHRYAVIAPTDVARLHGDALRARLRDAGLDAALFTFEPGEASKTREVWASLTDALLDAGYGRDSCIIAVGGGVAGDLAGFVAATYMRGVPVVQVPTTLLAMIDASVGGKTGVDTPAGKNLVGAYHPPSLVVADPQVLGTLPAAELRSGLSEAIKHGVMLDGAYFEWIEARRDDLLALDAAALEHLVFRSVELKAAVVSEDPLERGVRAVLNFGHTVGHALERLAGFTVLHGNAVAAGMVVEARVGAALGVTEQGAPARIAAVLDACGLPTEPPALGTAELLAAMRLDKKSLRAQVRCALPRRIGEAARGPAGEWTVPLPETALAAALEGASRTPRIV
jgi:3-dehydroquinate synthase